MKGSVTVSGGLLLPALLLLAGCSAGEDRTAADAAPETGPVAGVPAVALEDTLGRSRLLESVAMRCSDGSEVAATYWDVPAARVVISSNQRNGAVLPRLPGEDEYRYGRDSLTWVLAGDSALYTIGSRKITCRRDESVVF